MKSTVRCTCTEDVCDVKLSGVDQHLTTDLEGGIDGLYKLDGCFEGLPKYKRTGKTANGVYTYLSCALVGACICRRQ